MYVCVCVCVRAVFTSHHIKTAQSIKYGQEHPCSVFTLSRLAREEVLKAQRVRMGWGHSRQVDGVFCKTSPDCISFFQQLYKVCSV